MKITIKDLRKSAQKAVVLSELMNDKEKISTEDIIKYYPEGITINDCDPIMLDGDEFYVYSIKEKEGVFAFSGFVLTKMFNNMLSACEGDLEVLKKCLREEGLKVKLGTKKTKDNKKDITTVEVVE